MGVVQERALEVEDRTIAAPLNAPTSICYSHWSPCPSFTPTHSHQEKLETILWMVHTSFRSSFRYSGRRTNAGSSVSKLVKSNYSIVLLNCGIGGGVGGPRIGGLVVWFLAHTVHLPPYPWATQQTTNCSWQLWWQHVNEMHDRKVKR